MTAERGGVPMPGKFENQQQLVNKATRSIGSAPATAESVPAPHPVTVSPCHLVTLSPGHPPPLLLFDHVSKWYGPVIGVNQVTLELRPGITGLVGANGSGKSTLLQLATGQLR